LPSKNSLAAQSSAIFTSTPGFKPELLIASIINLIASSLDSKFGAKPPSSPTEDEKPLI
tara:strand:- start:500 stop:676 length:177 start_codon:yes stop_codon:yes gene_type:complete